MKITNDTHWQTRDIMKLIYRVAQDELESGQLKRRGIVRILYKRANGRSLGRCRYGSPLSPNVHMTLYLPREEQVDSVQLAKVIAHEFGHAKGLRHRDMNNNRYGWLDGWRERYAYAAEFQITAKPAVPKPDKAATLESKLSAALSNVKRWQTKLKRTKTCMGRWQRRVKYYERQVLVAAQKECS